MSKLEPATIIGGPVSPYVRKVLAACELKGVPYKVDPIVPFFGDDSFSRLSPLRPGRPPGWRKRGNHDVYEVLDELHGLAIWRRERRDSS